MFAFCLFYLIVDSTSTHSAHMTKLVRKLKQMGKKRAHRKAVQKRKAERAEQDLQNEQQRKEEQRLEDEVDLEMEKQGDALKKTVRVIGDLVLDVQRKKSKRLSRKQAKRKERIIAKGEDISDSLSKKWESKKRRVKARAQIRNLDLH